MSSHELTQTFLTLKQAHNIPNREEREFALRCLAVGCLLKEQIQVGNSVIDFLVINPKRNDCTDTAGTLVEVTVMSKSDALKKRVKKKINRKIRKVINKTGLRKQRQIEAMKNSGQRWAIMYGENLRNILISNTL